MKEGLEKNLDLWEKDFDRNNLTRWCRNGRLVKLRNQYYVFPDYLTRIGSKILEQRVHRLLKV